MEPSEGEVDVLDRSVRELPDVWPQVLLPAFSLRSGMYLLTYHTVCLA